MIRITIETTYRNLTEVINATGNPKVALRLLNDATNIYINRVGEVKTTSNGTLLEALSQDIWKEVVTVKIVGSDTIPTTPTLCSFKEWDELEDYMP